MENDQDYYINGSFITRERKDRKSSVEYFFKILKYHLKSVLVFTLIFFNKLFNKSTKDYKYKVSLCGIFKNEGRFLDEWIRYNIVIGVDHFYLYNNNSTDNYLQVLSPYIEQGIVDLIDWPFDHSQMQAYEDCYLKYKNETNWLTFLDVDEFVCPISTDNIQSWLSDFENYPGVAVYWRQFGSNGKLIHDNNQLVIEQYTQCWPMLGAYTKMFCNMNFPMVDFDNMHVFHSVIGGIKIPPINQFKKIISNGIHRKSIIGGIKIQINHYWNKAHDCFEIKINRTDAYHLNDEEMSRIRKKLFKSYELMCTGSDFTIQRFLHQTKSKLEITKP
jgi:hypothetical protein